MNGDASVAAKGERPTMATYVLLHGAYQGGWIWQHVTPHLRAAGHTVFAPTLDGCAERRHALRPGIDTESQAAEVDAPLPPSPGSTCRVAREHGGKDGDARRRVENCRNP